MSRRHATSGKLRTRMYERRAPRSPLLAHRFPFDTTTMF